MNNITANQPTKSATSFSITFSGENVLSLDEIWPDGNAPANPTTEDVLKAMGTYCNPVDLIREWNLDCYVEIDPV